MDYVDAYLTKKRGESIDEARYPALTDLEVWREETYKTFLTTNHKQLKGKMISVMMKGNSYPIFGYLSGATNQISLMLEDKEGKQTYSFPVMLMRNVTEVRVCRENYGA